jgi:AraC-like DNA-binding protein
MKYISLSGPNFNEYATSLSAAFKGMILPGRKGHVMDGKFGRITVQEYTCNDFRISSYYLEVELQVAIYPTANHPITALYLGTVGDFSIQLNNGPAMEMNAGTIGLFYLPAREQQKSYFEKGIYELMYIDLKGSYLSSIAGLHAELRHLAEKSKTDDRSVWHLPFLPMGAEMLGIIRRTFKEQVSPLTLAARITDLLASYFTLLDSSLASKTPAFQQEHLEKMMGISDYIENNLTDNISVSHLARKAAMNQFTFAHVFKKTFAVSPMEFIMQRRIHLAENLLLHSSCSVEEIAFKSGFSDRTHFYKAFNKIHGISPTKYRGLYGNADYAT